MILSTKILPLVTEIDFLWILYVVTDAQELH
jgi:hypothetical protein